VHELRAATLQNYLELAASRDIDGYWILRHAGVSPALLEDPENRLPAAAVLKVLDKSAQKSGCDSFGLLLAERRTFASLGPVALLLQHLGTLREVVTAAATYRRHINDIVTVDLEEVDGTALIKIAVSSDYASVQASDFALGTAYRVLTGAAGGRWQPSSVHVTRAPPGDPAIWRRFFAAPVAFESSFYGFACPSAALDEPNPRADPTMADHVRRLLDLVDLPGEDASVTDRTRRAIALLLPRGQTGLAQIATYLAMSPRSLQRNLADERQTFAGVLGEVRRELAQTYLAGSGRSITQISEELGYASPSAFTRWFSAEFGCAPQAWRSARQAQPTGPPHPWKV